MVNYSQHLRLLLLLCPLALGLAQEEQHEQQLEALHRSKRTLTTICVEIKPSGPQEEPYFMCKGTDFSRGGGQAQPAAEEQPQPIQNYPQPEAQPMPMNGQYAQAPFPSFPSFGAGFFPIMSNYEEATPKATPTSSYQNQSPAGESHAAAHFGTAPATFAAGPAPQSYGMPAVSYSAAGGAAAAARGTAAGSGPATTPNSYAAAAPTKSPPAAQAAPQPKSQPASSQASNGNPYDALVSSQRHRTAMDQDVLNVPDVGFRQEELNLQYRLPEPMVGAAPPMMWMPLAQTQLQQPTAAAQLPPYYDDPVMRTFYASLEPNEPQVAQAVPMQQAAPMEPLVAQVAPPSRPASGYMPMYGQTAPAAAAAPPTPPPSQPAYDANPKSSSGQGYAPAPGSPVDGNACNSCTRPCSAPLESTSNYNTPAHCPSFQPVIIAMPCYGQQQPTHYLAVPGSGASSPPALARESMVGSSFGGPFSLAAQMGSPFGNHFGMTSPQVGSAFGMGPQAGSAYGMSAPQLGSNFGMAPQVGAPFGLAPVLNPFGPFGSLNPFNPFNRILGAAAPTTQQPRLRLFGAPEESTTATLQAAPQYQQAPPKTFTLNFSSSTLAPASKVSSEPAAAVVGIARDPDDGQKEDDDDDQDDDEDGSHEVTDAPHTAGTTEDVASTLDAEVSKSLESKDLTVEQLLKKGEDKLKNENKRKRHNSRNSNSNSQKRKYLQRL
ncbi:DNA-directed RNA polymerase II subunit RPB1 [Drosophila novamexicana]|uniref:DNA-directed RNA polymerase II subunit RPB1 n=1 Tax=Drosophila novamexicana TaxID=47314 RepID=UPI0011E59E68|nr:DNA-directed RNA polymerase II subunit RPB1 [Drosophila novamexicana]